MQWRNTGSPREGRLQRTPNRRLLFEDDGKHRRTINSPSAVPSPSRGARKALQAITGNVSPQLARGGSKSPSSAGDSCTKVRMNFPGAVCSQPTSPDDFCYSSSSSPGSSPDINSGDDEQPSPSSLSVLPCPSPLASRPHTPTTPLLPAPPAPPCTPSSCHGAGFACQATPSPCYASENSPETSDTVRSALARSRAMVRTPEDIAPGQIGVWVSERVLSAVKRLLPRQLGVRARGSPMADPQVDASFCYSITPRASPAPSSLGCRSSGRRSLADFDNEASEGQQEEDGYLDMSQQTSLEGLRFMDDSSIHDDDDDDEETDSPAETLSMAVNGSRHPCLSPVRRQGFASPHDKVDLVSSLAASGCDPLHGGGRRSAAMHSHNLKRNTAEMAVQTDPITPRQTSACYPVTSTARRHTSASAARDGATPLAGQHADVREQTTPITPTSCEGPCVVFREGQPPLLQHASGVGAQTLEEIRLTGVVGETILASIPAIAATTHTCGRPDVPLVVKATIEPDVHQHSRQQHTMFSVSDTYLSLIAGSGRPVAMQIKLDAREAGEYHATLRLEYMGVQVRVGLGGLVRKKVEAVKGGEGGEDAWVRRGGVEAHHTASSAPIRWSRLAVGCWASREVRLRNVMAGPAWVRAYVDGGDGFNVEGGGKVEKGGVMTFALRFKPEVAGQHEATLRVVVWEGDHGDEHEGAKAMTHMSSRDGTLECWVGRGRRAYSLGLSGLAYEPADIRRPSTEPLSRPAAAFATRPHVNSGSSTDQATDAECDALSLSGDSFVTLKMVQPHVIPQAPSRCTSDIPPVIRRSPFFSSSAVDFGTHEVGSCTIVKVPLCNPLYESQLLLIEPVGVPFVILHRCIRLRPRAFVRLPIRFIPVGRGSFRFPLHATVHRITDGKEGGHPSADTHETQTLVMELMGSAVST